MRFLIAAAPGPETQASGPPDEALLEAYMRFNEELATAGVLVASEGLSGRKGAQVGVVDGRRVVLDGPFPETKELVGGFYVVEVDSLDEAVAWALKSPVGLGSDDVLTIHPMTGPSDLPPEFLALIERVAPTFSRMFTK